MARTATITDDDLTVDLSDKAAIAAKSPSGFGTTRFDPAAYDAKVPGEDALLFVENWELVVHGTDQDDLADKTRVLIKLLRRAFLYRTDQEYRESHQPVYITMQITGETNARYALVWGCRFLESPDLFGPEVTYSSIIREFGVTISRYIWRGTKPGVLPTVTTLTPTNGSASPVFVHVSNFRDDVNITHIFNEDISAGPAWSGNLHGTNGFTIFPDPIGTDDQIDIGSTDNFLKHIVLPKLSVAATLTTTDLKLYYYNGGWVELTLGTEYTLFPGPTLKDCLEQTDYDIVISVLPKADAVTVAVNGVTAYWILIVEAHVAPVYAVHAVTHAGQPDYAQRTPEVRIPVSALSGDVPPYLLARFHAPYGGDENEGFANISRIVIGSKENPGVFTSHLNAGGDDNPAGWNVSFETDTAVNPEVRSPGGANAHCDFGGDETMVNRLDITGTAKMGAWVGQYRVFITARQSGGAAGDLGVMLRTYIHESEVYSPKYDTKTVSPQASDNGPEVLDLGLLKIPFTRAANADDLTDADIIFEIHAERTTGAGEIYFTQLILIPVDKWSYELDDPIMDSVNGTSALRGDSVLQVDGGVLGLRTGKFIRNGAYLYPAEEWGRGGPSLMVEPETETYLYFVLMHFRVGGTWGEGPFIASMGCHVAVELYAHACYSILRGDD